MINCGIIGYGKMGKIRAATIENNGSGRVVSIYDTVVVECPFEQAQSAQAVIDDPRVDALFVCTPNYQIVPLCVAALNAGKHVFSEKPPAFNAQELEAVVEAEKRSSKKLMYGFNHRHHGSIQKMKSLVEKGEMGKILWMRGRYGKEVDGSYFEGWRADPEKAGGGILLDQGIHMLDLFLHFAGPFDEVHALVSNLYWKTPGLEDNVFAIMRNTTSGVCASLHSTMTQWRYLFSFEVFLEGGALILNGLKTSSGAYGDEDLAIKRNTSRTQTGDFQSEERIVYNIDESWAEEVAAFFAAITHDTPIGEGNSGDAMLLMKTLDRIYQKS
ncbi:MAG: Gfo/Idh/MocA family protein [Opitutales bacterium]